MTVSGAYWATAPAVDIDHWLPLISAALSTLDLRFMPWCDTCNAELQENQGTVVPDAVLKKGIAAGLRPSREWLQRRARLVVPPTVEAAEETWLKIFAKSGDDHLLCDACKTNLSRVLNVLL